jgi:hypothetical protein
MLRTALAALLASAIYGSLVYLGAAWFSWCMLRGKGGK